ncbi:hypothetical protein HDU76_000929 [Blyttiomyces sp. JEL0837]|nr:hypothetical protein HDU76_000929 [Blyttiomyces sp. JEL0837]
MTRRRGSNASGFLPPSVAPTNTRKGVAGDGAGGGAGGGKGDNATLGKDIGGGGPGGGEGGGGMMRRHRASIVETMDADNDLKADMIRATISNLEKSFKDNMSIRRLHNQPLTIFNSDSPGGGGLPELSSSSASDPIEEIISRAKLEVFKTTTARTKQAEMKLKKSKEEEALLRERTRQTREFFKTNHECMEAGPKFVYNFTCLFGEVVHVEMLEEENIFIVFGSKGMIEVWEYDSEQGAGITNKATSIKEEPIESINPPQQPPASIVIAEPTITTTTSSSHNSQTLETTKSQSASKVGSMAELKHSGGGGPTVPTAHLSGPESNFSVPNLMNISRNVSVNMSVNSTMGGGSGSGAGGGNNQANSNESMINPQLTSHYKSKSLVFSSQVGLPQHGGSQYGSMLSQNAQQLIEEEVENAVNNVGTTAASPPPPQTIVDESLVDKDPVKLIAVLPIDADAVAAMATAAANANTNAAANATTTTTTTTQTPKLTEITCAIKLYEVDESQQEESVSGSKPRLHTADSSIGGGDAGFVGTGGAGARTGSAVNSRSGSAAGSRAGSVSGPGGMAGADSNSSRAQTAGSTLRPVVEAADEVSGGRTPRRIRKNMAKSAASSAAITDGSRVTFAALGDGEEAPTTQITYGFFVGQANGEGLVVEMVLDKDNKNIEISIVSQRKISVSPLRRVCLAEYDDALVTFVSFNGLDQTIAAFNADLEDVWQCHVDTLTAVAKDKNMRTLQQIKLTSLSNGDGPGMGVGGASSYSSGPGNMKAPTPFSTGILGSNLSTIKEPEDIATDLCPDIYNKRTLVSLRTGSVLALSFETAPQSRSGYVFNQPTPPAMTLDKPRSTAASRSNSVFAAAEPVPRKDVHVSWLVDSLPLEQLKEMIKVTKNDEDDPPKQGQKQQQPPKKKSTPEVVGKFASFIPINHIQVFLNESSRIPHLIVGCTDGSLRVHIIDTGVITSLVPNLVQLSDDESKVDLAGFCSSRAHDCTMTTSLMQVHGLQFLLNYSNEGVLQIFDIIDNSVLIEMRVLADRFPIPATNTSGSGVTNKGGVLSNLQAEKSRRREIAVVSPSKELFIIVSGGEWSLMRATTLREWRLRFSKVVALPPSISSLE